MEALLFKEVIFVRTMANLNTALLTVAFSFEISLGFLDRLGSDSWGGFGALGLRRSNLDGVAVHKKPHIPTDCISQVLNVIQMIFLSLGSPLTQCLDFPNWNFASLLMLLMLMLLFCFVLTCLA